MSKALEAHEHRLGKVFASDFDFSIPGYQRPYRWGTDQALQLLDDLASTLEQDSQDSYFLGSLVLVRTGGHGFDVIDGQQRLTTLTIFFAVLRELSTGEMRRRLGELILEPGDVLEDLPEKPRLRPRAQDAAFFEKFIQRPGRLLDLIELSDNAIDTQSQRAMRDNARALFHVLDEWSEDRRDALARLAFNRTYLVVVSTPSIDSAHRIFSVMNARGLDLSPTDIFKSQLIGILGDESEHSKRWEDAEEALGGESFTELFRDIRTIFSGERARRELLREFPEQVLRVYLARGSTGAREFIDDIVLPYGEAFQRTIEFNYGPGAEWNAVNTWLRRLSLIDNQDWRPVVLWALKEYPDDAEFLRSFLERVERLAVSLLLRGVYTTPRIARYLDLLKQLKDGWGLDSPAFTLSDEEVAESRAALDGEVYRMQSRRARYVLLRLDELLAHDPGATYSHQVISIEHVLPQNPASDSAWLRDFSEEERDYWTHRLGNLLLLNRKKNSQARKGLPQELVTGWVRPRGPVSWS